MGVSALCTQSTALKFAVRFPNDNGRDFIIHHPSDVHGYDDGKLLLAIVTRANDSLV